MIIGDLSTESGGPIRQNLDRLGGYIYTSLE